jgi:hypothetical protein
MLLVLSHEALLVTTDDRIDYRNWIALIRAVITATLQSVPVLISNRNLISTSVCGRSPFWVWRCLRLALFFFARHSESLDTEVMTEYWSMIEVLGLTPVQKLSRVSEVSKCSKAALFYLLAFQTCSFQQAVRDSFLCI